MMLETHTPPGVFFIPRCPVCRAFGAKSNPVVLSGVNEILEHFNVQKFYQNRTVTQSEQVHVQVWWAYLEAISEYLWDNGKDLSQQQLHLHATVCVTYTKVFVSKLLPPVMFSTKTAEPWNSRAFIAF